MVPSAFVTRVSILLIAEALASIAAFVSRGLGLQAVAFVPASICNLRIVGIRPVPYVP